MIHPRIDDLLQAVDSRYALVIVAAKRARQINNYHHQLGEGTFDDNPPPLVESRSKNYLTMAMEEISEGLTYEYPSSAKLLRISRFGALTGRRRALRVSATVSFCAHGGALRASPLASPARSLRLSSGLGRCRR